MLEEQELKERLRWLVRLRWTGIVGVLVATHIVRELAFLNFSLIPVYGVLGFAALYNLYFSYRLKMPELNMSREALSQILLDQVTLSLAVYFSGGCDSPFIYFFIFHVVISGIILRWQAVLFISLLAVLFPAAVMGAKHFGLLPHYGIFKNELMIFSDFSLILSYGSAFVITIFLTAYFISYLSKKLYEKNEEVKRLYLLSERLRSTIKLAEVIQIIEKELCGFTGADKSLFIPIDRDKRLLRAEIDGSEVSIPLIEKNLITDTIFKGTPLFLQKRLITSHYEKELLELAGMEEAFILPVTAASIYYCWEYFHCTDSECRAFHNTTTRCWYVSGTHCKGRVMRNYYEKLNECLSCELFSAVGIYILNVKTSYLPLERIDTEACMRLLDAAGLAIANSLLYERTLALSRTDSLTGLLNNRTFKETLQNELLRAKRFQKSFGLIMIDIDYFKKYNDTHGHPQGDILIKKVAELIRENLKDTDIIARYGGEEFAILLPETTKEQTVLIAERLRSLIEWYRFPKEETQPGGKITISVGVAGYPEDGEKPEEILWAADSALYRAKQEGRNRVEAA